MAILLTSITPGLRSEVLGTAQFSVHSDNYGVEAYLPLIMLHVVSGYENPEGIFDPMYRLTFDDTRLDESDVDTVMVEYDNEGYHFIGTEMYLTDNAPQFIGVQFCIPSRVCCGYGGPVVYETMQTAFSLDTIDFYGADITSISIRLDAFTIDIVDGPWSEVYDIYCTVTVIVEGIPDDVPTKDASWGYIKTVDQ